MMTDGKFCDSHLHLVEPGCSDRYSDFEDADTLMACTARPEEWEMQIEMSDARIVKSYGVHPWYPEEWNGQSKDRLLSILEKDMHSHVGEIGLDYKRGSLKDQIEPFTEQLDIASNMGRVATIHMVGTEKDVRDIVKAHGKGCPGIILHSYGSDSYLKPFSETNCYFSVSPRILSRSDVRIGRLMSAIPRDRLLFETDSPHAGKEFTGMYRFVERIASITGEDPEQLLGTASDNLRRMLG